jgi:hypothetical protein
VNDGEGEQRHQVLNDENDDGESGIESLRESFDANLKTLKNRFRELIEYMFGTNSICYQRPKACYET